MGVCGAWRCVRCILDAYVLHPCVGGFLFMNEWVDLAEVDDSVCG